MEDKKLCACGNEAVLSLYCKATGENISFMCQKCSDRRDIELKKLRLLFPPFLKDFSNGE